MTLRVPGLHTGAVVKNEGQAQVHTLGVFVQDPAVQTPVWYLLYAKKQPL